MSTEEERALAAYRAMQEGGRIGGSATGASKSRGDADHYRKVARAALIARAHKQGLKAYSLHDESGAEFGRVMAADNAAARVKGKKKLTRDIKGMKFTAREIKS